MRQEIVAVEPKKTILGTEGVTESSMMVTASELDLSRFTSSKF